jgi:diguanylate cyclase (GGDEF)-like protein
MPISRRLFLSHFLAVLLVSGSIGSYFFLSAESSLTESIQSRLENTAALIAQTLDARDLHGIQGPPDRASPAYAANLRLIRNLARTNPDIAFVSVMRHRDGNLYFVLDSDESKDQAVPGREYKEHLPTLLRGFQRPSVDDRIAKDEWGWFMSGYAPVRNGNGEYLVGLDMRAEEFHHKLQAIRIAGILSLCLSVLFATVFSRMLATHFTKPMHMLIERCRAIAHGDPHRTVDFHSGDELEQLVDAFNAMSRQLTDSRDQAESARQSLKQAKDFLELRVVERTQALTEVNERLLHEVVERARAEEQLAQAARSDPLTNLMNRRAMLEHLEYQTARFRRSGTPFAILLGDLDRFKSINDNFGHDAGDEALIQTAQRLASSIRAQDLAARWGGEEFLILLPDTDLEGGCVVAEAVRASVAAQRVELADRSLALTLSLGVAVYGPGQTVNQCIKAADTALYRAKLAGRNQVVAAVVPSFDDSELAPDRP